MKRFNSICFYTVVFYFTTSCSSSYYKKSETIAQKMRRYETRGLDNNIVPKIPILKTVKFQNRGRNLASVKSAKGLNFSNKRLYFLGLLSQYESLRVYLPKNETADINICPSFHTSLVGPKYSDTSKIKTSSNLLSNRNYLSHLNKENIQAIYPELSLPLSEKLLYPTAYDLIYNKVNDKNEASKIISKAFQINLNKIHKELAELCETGFSSNYYIYENLITHIQNKGSLARNIEGIKILIKTGLFTNMALLNSLQNHKKLSRAPASYHKISTHNYYEKEIIRRLGVSWSESYFLKLGRL